MSHNNDQSQLPIDPVSVEKLMGSTSDDDDRYQLLLEAIRRSNRRRPGNEQHSHLVQKLEPFFSQFCNVLQRSHEQLDIHSDSAAKKAFGQHKALLVEVAFAYTSIASPPSGTVPSNSKMRLYAAEQGLRRHVQLIYIHQLHKLGVPNWWSDIYVLTSVQTALSKSKICGYFAVAVALYLHDHYAQTKVSLNYTVQALLSWSNIVELEAFIAPRPRPPYRIRVDFSLDSPPAASGWWQGSDGDELYEIDLEGLSATAANLLDIDSEVDLQRAADLLEKACGYGHMRREARLVVAHSGKVFIGAEHCFEKVDDRLAAPGLPVMIHSMSVNGMGLQLPEQPRLPQPGALMVFNVQGKWVASELRWIKAQTPMWSLGVQIVAADIRKTAASLNGQPIKLFICESQSELIAILPIGRGKITQPLYLDGNPNRFRLVERLFVSDDYHSFRFELIAT